MDTSRMTVEQIELVVAGRALAEETSAAVLAVALANAAAKCGNVPDGLAARVVAVCTALFEQQTKTPAGAVARRQKD